MASAATAAALADMDTYLRPADPHTRVLVLQGPGGVGKTELVKQYLQRCRGGPADALWFPADSPHALRAALYRHAARVGVAAHPHTARSLAECFLMAVVDRPEALLVFDDVRCTGDVAPYVPLARGKVVITTRCPDIWDIAPMPATTAAPAAPPGPGAAGPGWGRVKRVAVPEVSAPGGFGGGADLGPGVQQNGRGSEAVGQAVGGGCQSGWGRLLSVTNAIEAGTWRQGGSGWA